jgi:hypothetical protein
VGQPYQNAISSLEQVTPRPTEALPMSDRDLAASQVRVVVVVGCRDVTIDSAAGCCGCGGVVGAVAVAVAEVVPCTSCSCAGGCPLSAV